MTDFLRFELGYLVDFVVEFVVDGRTLIAWFAARSAVSLPGAG